jgi:hypothetical protein
MNRKRIRHLQVFTGAVVLVAAYCTFVALEAGEFRWGLFGAAATALNMNGYRNFTKILQANPK